MTNEEELCCFKAVNDAETFEDLKKAIEYIAGFNEDGLIVGKTKTYKLSKLLSNIEYIRGNSNNNYNVLTREYGIRQQAIYLHKYGEK